jgi:hypothetical protein
MFKCFHKGLMSHFQYSVFSYRVSTIGDLITFLGLARSA